MSRIADQLYFAPGIRFADLDLTGNRLPDQFRQRISGFYLKPAMYLADKRHTFAAGVLVICAMDALALLVTGSNSVGGRIESLCKRIPGLDSDGRSEMFTEDFRNGLVHEARIKNGSEFSLDIDVVAEYRVRRLAVNPLFLAKAVSQLLDRYVSSLYQNRSAQLTFRNKLKRKFRFELSN